ncbi:MAG TPA: choice-of-anchor L domain-containing protein [Flavobacteriales bacterium]
MNNKYQGKGLVVYLFAMLFATNMLGQLTVDENMTPEEMVQNLVGNGVQISNVVVTACDGSYGYYKSVNTELGNSEGILLTTGKAEYAIGPNDKIGMCSSSGAPGFINCNYFDNNCPGSPLLNSMHDRVTYDATMFEFDIVPKGDSLWFKYTFASEEYNEWVGSPFNDVFGFYISGPNVGTDVNLAVIPGTNQPVAINTVNATTNSQYWYDNSNPYGQYIQYDGFTVNLVAAIGGLIPCETYHLKLVIADGTDRTYDSGVFINAIESNPVVVLTATSNGLDYMVEGCNSGAITFSREFASPDPMVVNYWVGGTATNGVDYTPMLGTGDPFTPISITIPANEQSVTISLDAVADGIDEGTEYLAIYLVNPLCEGLEILDSVLFYIHDNIDVAVQAQETSICVGQCVELTGSSSLGALADFTWSAGVSDPNSLVVEVCPTETTTYTLTATIGACQAADSVTIDVSSISVVLNGQDVYCSAGNTGSITPTVNGGVGPYSYSWTGPNGFTSTDEILTGLAQGEYCVTVEDANGCIAQSCITLIETNVLNAFATFSSFVCYPISCAGACDGEIALSVTGGVNPYNFSWTGPNGFSSNSMNLTGLCAGEYQLEITDDAGCVFTNVYTLEEPTPLVIDVVGTVHLLCTGSETGSASVTTNGGCSPYIYTWSHDAAVTGPNATNLGSGTYDVSVTDQNGCTNDGTVTITINDPIDPVTAIIEEVSVYPGGYGVSCPGAEDGYINISTTGGTAPYSVVWSFASNNAIFSTDEDLADAPCGEYNMLVIDANNCTYSQNFIITCVPAITINYTAVPNPCGTPEGGLGEIDVTVSGGHAGTYTFSWSGPDGFTSNDEDLTGLNSGTYTLTVMDAESCSSQIQIEVGQNDMFTVTSAVTDVTCNNACDGSISIDIQPEGDYTIQWTGPNGFTSSETSLTDLCAGTYSVSVASVDCQETFTYTINEPLALVIETTPTHPTCFGQNNGSIDAEVHNGSGDYTYTWTSSDCTPPYEGSNSQNIGSLFGCDYHLEIVDNVTGCTASTTVSLVAPQVMSIVVETTNYFGGYNISCAGASDGQISVFVTGGTPDCTTFAPDCYFYDWVSAPCATSNPADYGNNPNASQLTNLPAGVYGVLVTDANGCLATTCIPLTEPDPIDSDPIIDHIDCGETTGSITPNITGGSSNYTSFQWTQGNIGNNAPNASTLTGLAAGTYTLVVTDSFGCEESFDFTINQTPTPVLSLVDYNNITCNASCNGSIVVTANSGTAPYSITIGDDVYTINNDNDQLTIQDLCAGVYTIALADANDCNAQVSVTLTEPQPLTLNLNAIIQEAGQTYHLQCKDDTNGAIAAVVSGGTGSYTFEWTDSDSNVLSANDTLTQVGAGTYCVKVTDENGCEITDCFEITEPEEALESTAVISVYNEVYNVSCFGATDGSIDITPTGGVGDYTYQWEGAGTIDGQQDQSNLAAGSYALVIVDENFCQLPFVFELVQPSDIVLDPQVSLFDGGYNISCNGECNGTITLNISGGDGPYTATWTGPNGFTSTDTDLSNLCAGTYNVTVVDANGCEKQTEVILMQPEPLHAVISNDYNCTSSVAELCVTGTGGSGTYTYLWSTNETTACISVNTSGQYCVTITDSNGCEEEVCYNVTITTPLVVTGIITDESCDLCNGAVNTTITASPGYTFQWSNNATTEDLTGLCPGVYLLTVTDVNNCTTAHSFTVVASPPIEVTVTSTDVACYGGTEGTVMAEVTGATEPITMSWADDQGNIISTSGAVVDLPAGVYTFNWSDAAGCTGTESVTVAQPEALDVWITTSIYGDFNISTVNGSDGFIELEVTGGTPQYTYEWSHDSNINASNVYNLPAGVYAITIIDAHGCVLDTTVTLISPEEVRLFNGLTPNGDGFNDTYVIPGVLYCTQNTFTVFNRWGNIVYEKNNYQNDWYGQSNDGGMLADGTYFVIFEGCNNKKLSTYVDLRRE